MPNKPKETEKKFEKIKNQIKAKKERAEKQKENDSAKDNTNNNTNNDTINSVGSNTLKGAKSSTNNNTSSSVIINSKFKNNKKSDYRENLYLTKEIQEKLNEISQETGYSKSELARLAFEYFFDNLQVK
ncbi:MAG: hypothetical protein ACOCP4_06600 [Candidatus Woesearchaeota archaeon]